MDLWILAICGLRDLQILRFMDFKDIPKERVSMFTAKTVSAVKSAVSFFHFLWSALSDFRSDCSFLSSSVHSLFSLDNFRLSFFIETRSLSNSTLSAVIFIHSIDTLCCSLLIESRCIVGVVGVAALLRACSRCSDLVFLLALRFGDDDDLGPSFSFTVSPSDFYLDFIAQSDCHFIG